MSIIEEAVRKTAEKHNRLAPAAPRDAIKNRPRPRRVVPPPAETTPAREFQQFNLDRQVLEENNILPQITDSAALRAYKILRTRLLRRLDANQWRSLAVTGATAGEGKTLTAINLAMALAQDVNTWVFLVDLDLQRPRVADYLGMTGMSGEKGLSDYLLHGASFESVVYSPQIERLAVLPNFESISNSSDLMTSARMIELVEALEAESPRRIVVFDMPPVLASDDVLAFSPQVDGLLMVVGEGFTTRESLLSAREVLAEMNLLGVVLNRSAERNDSYSYYHYDHKPAH
jgi:protein-tyrosine kinase